MGDTALMGTVWRPFSSEDLSNFEKRRDEMVEARLRARRHGTQLSFPDGCSALRRARMRRITCQVALAGGPTFPG